MIFSRAIMFFCNHPNQSACGWHAGNHRNGEFPNSQQANVSQRAIRAVRLVQVVLTGTIGIQGEKFTGGGLPRIYRDFF